MLLQYGAGPVGFESMKYMGSVSYLLFVRKSDAYYDSPVEFNPQID